MRPYPCASAFAPIGPCCLKGAIRGVRFLSAEYRQIRMRQSSGRKAPSLLQYCCLMRGVAIPLPSFPSAREDQGPYSPRSLLSEAGASIPDSTAERVSSLSLPCRASLDLARTWLSRNDTSAPRRTMPVDGGRPSRTDVGKPTKSPS